MSLRRAGFGTTVKSVSAETKGRPEDVSAHADMMLQLLDGSFGSDVVDHGWGDDAALQRLRSGVREWGKHPDSFFANVHVEVIGWTG